MACPLPQSDPCAVDRPPARGWYWNANHLARAWLPLIGPEGLGLLDFYLASADHRPGASAPGWAAVTLDELARLTGWGRARLVRLNRLLTAAGLLTVRYRPVPGYGPAVQRAFYRVERQAPPPTAAALARLTPLAERDPALAARLRRYTLAAPTSDTPPADADAASGAGTSPVPAVDPAPVPADAPAPVLSQNRSEDGTQTTGSITTTSARPRVTISDVAPSPSRPRATALPEVAEPLAVTSPAMVGSASGTNVQRTYAVPAPAPNPAAVALDLWRAANGRPASALERQRLAQLAAQAARGAGDGDAGWTRVGAAIVEAVDAGSAFVAPRRVARILDRWLADDQAAQPVRPVSIRRDPRAAIVTPASPSAPALDADDGCVPPTAADPSLTTLTPAAPVWAPPVTIAGLPAAPAAMLRAALAAAGLQAEPYLRGAALAGWSDATEGGRPVLRVTTPAPVPPAIVARLQPRLSQGLSAVLGRPVAGRLTPVAALVAAPAGEVLD